MSSKSPFAEAWSLPLESGSYANVCVSSRHAFVGDEHTVAAYDAATGRRLWAYPVPARLVAAVADGVVVDVCDGELHVVDAETGHPRLAIWSSLVTSSRVEPGDRTSTHVGKQLFLLGTHQEHERQMLRAVDLESGQRRWTHWPEGWAEGIAASATKVVMTLRHRKAVALDAADGRVCWEYDGKTEGPPVVDEGRVFVARSGSSSTQALDLETGHPVWASRRRLDWVRAGMVYTLSEDDERIESFDAATGRRKPSSDLPIERPPSLRQHTPFSILLMSETHVFMAGLRDASAGKRSLLCLDRATGQVSGYVNPDVGEVYPPALTTTGLCYRTSTRLYGLRQA
jgi:outer membrane protein assembly factor BamB